jgi:Putative zinc-finger
MKCRLCEDKLLEYLYGELGEKDAAAMEGHLKASEECRRAYESFQSVLEAVAGTEEAGLPTAVHTRIMGRAEEIVSQTRSFWALMFRPAVTTAVIGAITAGVYFATIRHKPPSYLDERIVSEESFQTESKQSQTEAPHPVEEVEPPRKEAADQAIRSRPSESYGGIEGEGVGTEERKSLGKTKRTMPTLPSEREKLSLEGDSLNEEQVLAPAGKKAESIRGDAPQLLMQKPGSALTPQPQSRVVSAGAPPSSQPASFSLKGQVPEIIEGAMGLASDGHCTEAEQKVSQCSAEHPKDPGCGAGWLEVARCFLKKGDTEEARRAAQKALAIPAHAQEAQAFLESLPPSPQ